MPEVDPQRRQRRRRLELTVKLLAAALVLAFAATLMDSVVDLPDPFAGAPALTVDLAAAAPGEVRLVDWGGRQVLVQRRDGATIDALAAANPALADSASAASMQPEPARNRYRSLRPEFFVALAHDTGPGCLVEWLPAGAADAPAPWHGGFRDRCAGSWYDAAGRVYRGQSAPRNLIVPPHHFRTATELVLGG